MRVQVVNHFRDRSNQISTDTSTQHCTAIASLRDRLILAGFTYQQVDLELADYLYAAAREHENPESFVTKMIAVSSVEKNIALTQRFLRNDTWPLGASLKRVVEKGEDILPNPSQVGHCARCATYVCSF